LPFLSQEDALLIAKVMKDQGVKSEVFPIFFFSSFCIRDIHVVYLLKLWVYNLLFVMRYTSADWYVILYLEPGLDELSVDIFLFFLLKGYRCSVFAHTLGL
jgi:hypothetical protein